MTIPVQITFRHMESSPAVETRVRELANRLGTFSDRIQGCRVVVDSPHRHQHQGKVFNVKVQLTLPGDDVVVGRPPDAEGPARHRQDQHLGGQDVRWLIVGLTFMMTWEIFSRRFFDRPHAWTFDAQMQMYGILFMTAGAYTLSKSGHVRGDVLYGFFSDRVQATIDLVLYVLFFIPGIVALTYAGTIYAGESWASASAPPSCSRGRPSTPSSSSSPSPGAAGRSPSSSWPG